MIAALLLSLLAQAPAASAAPANTAVASQSALHEHRLARFFFYRLQFFHDKAARQGCARVQPERTRALDERYAAAERRVVALSGPVSLDPDPAGGEDGFDGDCRIGIILRGYENALHALERHLAGAER